MKIEKQTITLIVTILIHERILVASVSSSCWTSCIFNSVTRNRINHTSGLMCCVTVSGRTCCDRVIIGKLKPMLEDVTYTLSPYYLENLFTSLSLFSKRTIIKVVETEKSSLTTVTMPENIADGMRSIELKNSTVDTSFFGNAGYVPDYYYFYNQNDEQLNK